MTTPKKYTGKRSTHVGQIRRTWSAQATISRGQTFFNGDALNGSPAIAQKPEAPSSSWWMAPSREEFNEAREKRRPQMQSATEQNVRPNF